MSLLCIHVYILKVYMFICYFAFKTMSKAILHVSTSFTLYNKTIFTQGIIFNSFMTNVLFKVSIFCNKNQYINALHKKCIKFIRMRSLLL